MTYVYIDVLLILNIYVNYFLLRSTARLTHTVISRKRLAFTSAVGSLSSLTILLPPLGVFVNLIMKLSAASLLVFIAFGKRKPRAFLCLCGVFFTINFAFAGVFVALSYLLDSPRVMMNNTSLYIDFSVLSLVIFTAAAYLAICLLRRTLDKGSVSDKKYRMIIRVGSKSADVPAICDSGNLLLDSFSGAPVVVCGYGTLAGIVPCRSELCTLRGFRLIPCSTVTGSAVMPAFRPDSITIYADGEDEKKRVDALVGISPEGASAVFNPKLL